MKGKPHYLSPRDTFILHQSTRVLVIKTKLAATDVVIASVYAPHEKSTLEVKAAFWKELTALAEDHSIDVLLGDP